MRRSERRHLKRNEVVTWVTQASVFLERQRRTLLVVGGLVLVAVVGVGAYATWQSRSDDRTAEILAQAVSIMNAPVVAPGATEDMPIPGVTEVPEDPDAAVNTDDPDGSAGADGTGELPAPVAAPPGSYATERERLEAALDKFMEAARAQPDGRVGLSARYHAAAILADLGRTDEAAEAYRHVADSSRAGIYGRMARLGLAEVAALRGDFEAARQTWSDLATGSDPAVPVDAALMQLGTVEAMAGNEAEAIAAYRRIVDEFPASQYATPAQQEIDRLEGRGLAPVRP